MSWKAEALTPGGMGPGLGTQLHLGSGQETQSFIAKLDTVFEDRPSSVSVKGLCAWCSVIGVGVGWEARGKPTSFTSNQNWRGVLRDVKPRLAGSKLAWILVVVGIIAAKPSCGLRNDCLPSPLTPLFSLVFSPQPTIWRHHHRLLDFSLGISVLC